MSTEWVTQATVEVETTPGKDNMVPETSTWHPEPQIVEG